MRCNAAMVALDVCAESLMERPAADDGEPDEATIEACRRGDRRALGRVFDACAPTLERQLRAMLGLRADIEDLLQVTFVEAMRAFPGFRGESSVRTWLSRICANVAKQYLRGTDRRRRALVNLSTEADVRPGSALPSASDLVEGRQRIERFSDYLEELSPKSRAAFVLHVIEGRPTAEIAVILGLSDVAVRSRIFLARRGLLTRMREDPLLRDLCAVKGES